MTEEEKNSTEEEKEPYVPASPVKRIIAWVGVVYMVIIVFLNFYAFMRGGYLGGIGPLLICPGMVGLGIIALYRYKQEVTTVRKAGMVALFVACVLLLIMGLVDGMPALLAGLGAGA